MATYTVNVTLTPGNMPPITVDQETVIAAFGTDTIIWVPASGQSGWIFKNIVFDPDGAFSNITVNDQSIQVTDSNQAVSAQFIYYTLFAEQNGTPYKSDPYVLNDPNT